MRKLLFILFTLNLIGFGYTQKFERFSDDEKWMIQSGVDSEMRVYNLNKPLDSITLKSVSKPIKPNDKLTQQLVERMSLSVKKEGGVGIAAPQVGILRRLVLVQRFDKADKPFEVFINPEIIWASDLMQLGHEGDLSFDENGQVMRHYAVQISYQNLEGQTITEVIEAFTAVIFQHERDHLDGILLTDRIEEQKKLEFIPAKGQANLFYPKNN